MVILKVGVAYFDAGPVPLGVGVGVGTDPGGVVFPPPLPPPHAVSARTAASASELRME
jgi:hypothetical protein